MKMRKSLIAVIAAGTALAGVAAGTAWAQDEAPPSAERPAMTRDAVPERAGMMFARMDTNSDGVLDEADQEARQRQMFDKMDADNNGTIEFSEFTAAGENMREMRGEGSGRRGGGDMAGRDMAARMIANADSDGDGAVSQAEFSAAMLARFDAADANGDGEISSDERSSMRESRRASRPGQSD